MNDREYLDLFNLDDESLKVLDLYRQTMDMYSRIKNAMGRKPLTFQVSNSSNQEVKVENGTNSSTKIFTCQ
jgi:hypothetical protein